MTAWGKSRRITVRVWFQARLVIRECKLVAQDTETGREASAFGRRIARTIATELGAEWLDGKSNKVSVDGQLAVIKTARTSAYIGITKSMFPCLVHAFAAVPGSHPGTFDI